MESMPQKKDNPPELRIITDNKSVEKTKNTNSESQETAKIKPIDENITLEKTLNHVNDISIIDLEPTTIINQAETKKTTFSLIDLYPRISGKINGNITKSELLNDNGLITNSDIEVVSFELHMIDGSGGKVFTNSGNLLTQEMKSAIKKIGAGDEIYFEKINGKATSGEIIRLSPIRYILLN